MTVLEGLGLYSGLLAFGGVIMSLSGIYIWQALRFRREDKLRRERGK